MTSRKRQEEKIEIRVDPDLKSAVQAVAKSRGLTLSAWAKQIFQDAVDKAKRESQERRE